MRFTTSKNHIGRRKPLVTVGVVTRGFLRGGVSTSTGLPLLLHLFLGIGLPADLLLVGDGKTASNVLGGFSFVNEGHRKVFCADRFACGVVKRGIVCAGALAGGNIECG